MPTTFRQGSSELLPGNEGRSQGSVREGRNRLTGSGFGPWPEIMELALLGEEKLETECKPACGFADADCRQGIDAPEA